MRKLIASEWVSLDGIFDASLMAQWFNPYHSDSRAAYIQDTIDNCDAMLYGRVTYEMLYPYWSSFQNNEMGVAAKLNSVDKYLVSNTLENAGWQNTTVFRDSPLTQIEALKQQPGGNILVQGSGILVNALLKAGLLDELKLLVQPHIAGQGRKLFADGLDTGLLLTDSKTLDKGVIALTYKPA